MNVGLYRIGPYSGFAAPAPVASFMVASAPGLPQNYLDGRCLLDERAEPSDYCTWLPQVSGFLDVASTSVPPSNGLLSQRSVDNSLSRCPFVL